MKLRFYWRYATRALRRGGQRTLLAIGCVAIGVMAIVAMQTIGAMVNNSLTTNVRALNGGDIDVSSVRLTVDQLRYFDQLEAQGAISNFSPVESDNGSAQSPHPVDRFDIRVVDPSTFPLAGAPTFIEPANGQLDALLTGVNVVLTRDLAQQMGAQVGTTFPLIITNGHSIVVTVSGVIANAGIFQSSQLLLSTSTYAMLRPLSDPSTFYDEIYVDVPGHSATLAAAAQQLIEGQFAGVDAFTTSMLLRQNEQQVAGIRSFLRIVGLVALLLGGMGIIDTMQVLLRRRRVEIAMLKANGYNSRDLIALFGLEASLLGLLGGIAGAGLGIGVSAILRNYVGQAFSLQLTLLIDPLILTSGLAVGVVTALIFSIMPIAEASQVRPIAILRELPGEAGRLSWVSSLSLGALIAVLCYALTASILQDAVLAGILIVSMGIIIGLLALLFGLLARLIGKIHLPRWLPGKTVLMLALRNLARQRGSTVTTQIAIFIGVFAFGLILILGQSLQTQYAVASGDINVAIWTSNLTAVQQQLQQSPAVTRQEIYPEASFAYTTVNGDDISAAVAAGTYITNGVYPFDNMLGFDLAHGKKPDTTEDTLVVGRMLDVSDANTDNVVVNAQTMQPPVSLKLGDQIVVHYAAKFGGVDPTSPAVTLHVVGFYQDNAPIPSLQSNMLADDSVIESIAGSKALYLLGVHIDPQQADAVLTNLQAALPGQVFVHSYVDLFAQVQTYLNTLMLILEAIILPALLAAIINIANAVALTLLDRRREVGILKAVGYSSRSVLNEVALEQGIAGMIAATAALICAASSAILLSAGFSKGGLPANPSISVSTSLALLGGTIIIAMLVAIGVAWSAAYRRPLDVLRYE